MKAAATAGLILCAFPALGQDVNFFAGKTITLVVGSEAGGGYDTNARVMARHFGRFIPGNPEVVVQNMPGAGSIIATNWLYNLAPKDGTAIGLIQRGNMLANIVHQTVQYDLRKIEWIGNLATEPGLIVAWHSAPQKTIADVLKMEFVVGGSGPLGENETIPRLLNAVVGTKFRIVSGYPSNPSILLAMERGEVQGNADWSWSNIKTRKPEYLREKKVTLLLQTGMEKEPDLPDLPLGRDLAKTPLEQRTLDTLFSLKSVARPLMAPPGAPADRLRTLRAAFMAMAADAAFRDDAEKAGLDVNPTSGEAVDRVAKFIADTPEDAARILEAAIRPPK